MMKPKSDKRRVSNTNSIDNQFQNSSNQLSEMSPMSTPKSSIGRKPQNSLTPQSLVKCAECGALINTKSKPSHVGNQFCNFISQINANDFECSDWSLLAESNGGFVKNSVLYATNVHNVKELDGMLNVSVIFMPSFILKFNSLYF